MHTKSKVVERSQRHCFLRQRRVNFFQDSKRRINDTHQVETRNTVTGRTMHTKNPLHYSIAKVVVFLLRLTSIWNILTSLHSLFVRWYKLCKWACSFSKCNGWSSSAKTVAAQHLTLLWALHVCNVFQLGARNRKRRPKWWHFMKTKTLHIRHR